jgi:hypothetical protein
MKNYEVKIHETVIHTTWVEAEDEEKALEAAYEKIANGPDSEYDTEAEGFTGYHEIEEYDAN